MWYKYVDGGYMSQRHTGRMTDHLVRSRLRSGGAIPRWRLVRYIDSEEIYAVLGVDHSESVSQARERLAQMEKE